MQSQAPKCKDEGAAGGAGRKKAAAPPLRQLLRGGEACSRQMLRRNKPMQPSLSVRIRSADIHKQMTSGRDLTIQTSYVPQKIDMLASLSLASRLGAAWSGLGRAPTLPRSRVRPASSRPLVVRAALLPSRPGGLHLPAGRPAAGLASRGALAARAPPRARGRRASRGWRRVPQAGRTTRSLPPPLQELLRTGILPRSRWERPCPGPKLPRRPRRPALCHRSRPLPRSLPATGCVPVCLFAGAGCVDLGCLCRARRVVGRLCGRSRRRGVAARLRPGQAVSSASAPADADRCSRAQVTVTDYMKLPQPVRFEELQREIMSACRASARVGRREREPDGVSPKRGRGSEEGGGEGRGMGDAPGRLDTVRDRRGEGTGDEAGERLGRGEVNENGQG